MSLFVKTLLILKLCKSYVCLVQQQTDDLQCSRSCKAYQSSTEKCSILYSLNWWLCANLQNSKRIWVCKSLIGFLSETLSPKVIIKTDIKTCEFKKISVLSDVKTLMVGPLFNAICLVAGLFLKWLWKVLHWYSFYWNAHLPHFSPSTGIYTQEKSAFALFSEASKIDSSWLKLLFFTEETGKREKHE